ncbi:hypothetical protein DB30_02064 [Enhygromyxa salina]|uniref:Uncharacterized protein n=1 Tax=Enhygromyxa salina TaxID=215803 RepID=A0A0C2CW17_9BACT|nr:hypothetical protein DB30_02064 [Enhygromyxa salina]
MRTVVRAGHSNAGSATTRAWCLRVTARGPGPSATVVPNPSRRGAKPGPSSSSLRACGVPISSSSLQPRAPTHP